MHTTQKNFKCEICLKSFSYKRGLDSHKRNWHDVSLGITCLDCKNKFLDKYFLNQHMKDFHEKTKEFNYEKLETIKDGRVRCLDCSKTYSNCGIAKTHYKNLHLTDKNVRNIKCKVCNKDFAVEKYMKNHMKAIHGVHYRLNCLECNKTFSSKGCLKRHMKVHVDKSQRFFSHSGIKKKSWEKKLIPIEGTFVKCLDCNKSYSSMHAAKKHFKEVHLKLISFKCLFETFSDFFVPYSWWNFVNVVYELYFSVVYSM
jgi:hypothetical protein